MSEAAENKNSPLGLKSVHKMKTFKSFSEGKTDSRGLSVFY